MRMPWLDTLRPKCLDAAFAMAGTGAANASTRLAEGYAELEEVHLCAFTEREAQTLVEVASEMGLESVDVAKSAGACDFL